MASVLWKTAGESIATTADSGLPDVAFTRRCASGGSCLQNYGIGDNPSVISQEQDRPENEVGLSETCCKVPDHMSTIDFVEQTGCLAFNGSHHGFTARRVA